MELQDLRDGQIRLGSRTLVFQIIEILSQNIFAVYFDIRYAPTYVEDDISPLLVVEPVRGLESDGEAKGEDLTITY